MAPTGSDGTTTDLAGPDTAKTSSDNAEATATPFGDWREQLRERVKEIRARKHAVHREDVDEIALNAAVTTAAEEKLEVAREQSAASGSESETQSETGTVDKPSVQLVHRERASRRAEIAGVVDDLLGSPEARVPMAPTEFAEPVVDEEPEEPAAQMEPEEPVMETVSEDPVQEAPPAPSAAPLFQQEPTVYADDPILEIADEFEHHVENAEAATADPEAETLGAPAAGDETVIEVNDAAIEAAEAALEPEIEDAEPLEAAAETEPEPQIEAELEPAAEPEPEPEPEPDPEPEPEMSVATTIETEVDETPTEPAAIPVGNTEVPDNSPLDGIPPELRDVEIPAWALPREPSRSPQSTASSETDEMPADTFLVGEYTSHEGSKRTDLGPPPDTPIPTAEMLDQPIGDLSAQSEGTSREVDFPKEEVEIAPPGGLVNAADFEPSSREEAPEASRTLPGLFDITDAPASEETSRPGLFFDEPLDTQEVAEDVPEEPVEDTEKAPRAAVPETTSAPVAFFDEPVAADKPAAKEEPWPTAALDESVAEDEPIEAAGEATPREAAEEEVPEDKVLEWDVDSELDAEMVADSRGQHVDASAPMSDRVYSAIADALVLLTIGLVLMIAGASAAGSPVVSFVRAAPIPFLAAWSLFGLVYGVIFVGTCGQTIGKMAMCVRVIGADTFHVGYARAALRALAYTAAALPAGLGLLTAIRDPEHRGMHDRLTGTRVVKA